MASKPPALHEAFDRKEKIEGSSDRSFGVVFAVVFTIIGLWPWGWGTGGVRLWALAVAAAFAALALVYPSSLAPLNRLWFKFGLLLARVVSPIVLGLVYYLAVLPTGLMLKLFGKDPLRRQLEPAAQSYWIERDPPGPAPESMADQF